MSLSVPYKAFEVAVLRTPLFDESGARIVDGKAEIITDEKDLKSADRALSAFVYYCPSIPAILRSDVPIGNDYQGRKIEPVSRARLRQINDSHHWAYGRKIELIDLQGRTMGDPEGGFGMLFWSGSGDPDREADTSPCRDLDEKTTLFARWAKVTVLDREEMARREAVREEFEEFASGGGFGFDFGYGRRP